MPTISYTTQFRANCKTCGKKYTWHPKEHEAEDDAARHQKGKPTHIVNIEKKITEHSAKQYA